MSRFCAIRLRRCRALFALALCAWLALVGMAWAGQDCCAGMGGDAAHAATHLHHHHASADAHTGCVCAHGAAALPALAALAPAAYSGGAHWPALPAQAPAPVRPPPLRPPLG